MKQLSEKQKAVLNSAAKKKLSSGADSRTLNALINRGFLSKKLYRAHVNGFHANSWFYEITDAGMEAL